MAYLQAQTLVDTDRRHVTKRVNSGNTETLSVAVNAASLLYAISTLTTASSANNFKVGETVNATSGGSATVLDILGPTTVLVVNVTGVFDDADVVTGATTGKARTQSGALVAQTYDLHASRIIFNVGGPDAAKLELSWEGTGGGANNRVLAVLSGSGELLLDAFGMRANNTANSATGNVLVSTLGWDANSHYTLWLDVSKASGYAKPDALVRNQELGY